MTDPQRSTPTATTGVTDQRGQPAADQIAVEEPMEIRIVYGPADDRKMRSLSITMRTPGEDEQLATGFLLTEAILDSPDQIERFHVAGTDAAGGMTGNIVRVDLREDVPLDLSRLQRHFFATSSCGVCGKASLETLSMLGWQPIPNSAMSLSASLVRDLPDRLRHGQPNFALTGGMHAAGLFEVDGTRVAICEDVGRHNAVDKLIGRMFLEHRIPLSRQVLVISGRASFEIMQKALAGGIPIVVAVGAPSSLAVALAEQYNMTLVGFASQKRFNIYAGAVRIAME